MAAKKVTAKQAELLNYAWLSGDRNPIHYNTEVANKMKLPGVIAQGMWVHSRCWSEIEKLIARLNSQEVSKKWSFEDSQTKFQSMLKEGDSFEVFFENEGLEKFKNISADQSVRLKVVARSLDQLTTYAVITVNLKLL